MELTNIKYTDSGVVHQYLFKKFSTLLDEAEKDGDLSTHPCFSRLRNAENLIKSNYADAINTSEIRQWLYDLISALSDCRLQIQRHRGAVTPKNAILKFRRSMFVRKMNGRLDKIENEIEKKLFKELKKGLGSENASSADPNSNPIDDDSVYGEEKGLSGGYAGLDSAAEKVKEFIVKGCEDDTNKKLKGFGIVGIGGSGKTTLARKVFWDLRNSFSPRIWVSLSGTLYDAPVSGDLRVKILRKMLVQAGCYDSEWPAADGGDISMLTQLLYCRLKFKKYLIVLDEVWRVNGWYRDLCSELPKGDASFRDHISHALPKDSGGRIIVTSRREAVAREMVGRENLLRIDTLLYNESLLENDTQLEKEKEKIGWSVFCNAVREGGKVDVNDNTLSEMKEIITEKCAGLPLAARTLATIIPEQIRNEALAGYGSGN